MIKNGMAELEITRSIFDGRDSFGIPFEIYIFDLDFARETLLVEFGT
jgi:hypothetical protein